MPDVWLEVSSLTLRREAAQLGPVSFTLPRPGCWWLTGPSGAGKSLLLESLAGFHAKAEGDIRIGDGTGTRDVGDLAPEHRSIVLMPQRWRLFPHWNVARNLRFAAQLNSSLRGPRQRTRIHQLAERLQVAHLLRRGTRALSGGETQRIALIQTLLSPAGVLLLDEPLSAVDAVLQSAVLELLTEESAQNQRIVLIAAHRPLSGHSLQGILAIEKGQLID
jgi:ABC-type sugar transport system ATPase subunit